MAKRIMVVKTEQTYRHQIECRYCGLLFSEETNCPVPTDRLYRRRDEHVRLSHSREYWNTWVKLND